jgi:hypothetical protein
MRGAVSVSHTLGAASAHQADTSTSVRTAGDRAGTQDAPVAAAIEIVPDVGRNGHRVLATRADRALARLFSQMEQQTAPGTGKAFDIAAGLERFTAWLGAPADQGPDGPAGPPHAVPVQDVADLRGGPDLMRALLGSQLRRLREAAAVTTEAAAWAIRGSTAKITRLELGQCRVRERDLADLLTLYGVRDAPGREQLFYLARRASARPWWHDYDDIVPGWFEVYMGLEEAAAVIRTYEVLHIPALLQTAAYARAVMRAENPLASSAEIERRTEMLQIRQRLVSGRRPPHLWALIDEAALRRPTGGTEVMRDQLQHLIQASRLPHVAIQIMPLSAGATPAAGGSFSILRLVHSELPDVVYTQHLSGALYLDDPSHVTHYTAVMNEMAVRAEPPSRTSQILRDNLTRLSAMSSLQGRSR